MTDHGNNRADTLGHTEIKPSIGVETESLVATVTRCVNSNQYYELLILN